MTSPTRRSGAQIVLRLSEQDRAILDAASGRAKVSLSEYVRTAALERAVQGGIVIPFEVAAVIRQQAEERGIDETTLAALIAQAALTWPRTLVYCGEAHPVASHWCCSRPRGHEGDHVAADGPMWPR